MNFIKKQRDLLFGPPKQDSSPPDTTGGGHQGKLMVTLVAIATVLGSNGGDQKPTVPIVPKVISSPSVAPKALPLSPAPKKSTKKTPLKPILKSTVITDVHSAPVHTKAPIEPTVVHKTKVITEEDIKSKMGSVTNLEITCMNSHIQLRGRHSYYLFSIPFNAKVHFEKKEKIVLILDSLSVRGEKATNEIFNKTQDRLNSIVSNIPHDIDSIVIKGKKYEL